MDKVLVLGHTGMLGHMVKAYLETRGVDVDITVNRYPSVEFTNDISIFEGQYIVNCIGGIPQKGIVDFSANTNLPKLLEEYATARIIHPGTDCELDSDPYGISKRMASEFIIEHGTKTKIIQTTVFGPELTHHVSFFDWFMYSSEEVSGWTRAYCNGITTLQWAKLCYDMMLHWNSYDVRTIPGGKCISKYDILCLIKEVFEKDIVINKNNDLIVNKCLQTNFESPSLKTQLIELKEFIGD